MEVVQYRVGETGFQDVGSYDARRYQGRANEYKQAIMAAAYRELLGDLNGKRVLDVGCGTGRGAADFAAQASFTIGADASLDMLTVAARKVGGAKACGFSAAYAQQLPFKSESFDVVASLNFLHLFTVDTQRQMIEEMKRVLRPNGILVLEFDNALHGLGLGLLKRWFGKERGSLPQEIRQAIGAGCTIERVYGAVLPVVWRVFSKHPDLSLPIERLTLRPGLNRLAHRVYYKVRKTAA
jgi:ubiquinone/menaquinone biosynthesis C-methylase UbiE